VLVIIHIKDDKFAYSITEKEMHAGTSTSRKEKNDFGEPGRDIA
jgi:hypothetical protein